MKYVFAALLFFPMLLQAQAGDVFTVKKKTQTFVPGYYCSDYMTDGRACFYFDSTGTVRMFNSDKTPEKVPAAFAQKPNALYTANYIIKGDTVSFVATLYFTPGDFNPMSGKQITTVKGQFKDDKIRLIAVTDVNGRVSSTRETFVRRIYPVN